MDKLKEHIKKQYDEIVKIALEDNTIDGVAGIIPENARLGQLSINTCTLSFINKIIADEEQDILDKYASIKYLMEIITKQEFKISLEDEFNRLFDMIFQEVEKESNIIPVDFTGVKN